MVLPASWDLLNVLGADDAVWGTRSPHGPNDEVRFSRIAFQALVNVNSVFGRTGDVVADNNDYDADQIAETASRKFINQAGLDKLGNITITQPVDLDAIETRVNALDAAVVLVGSWDPTTAVFPGGGTAQAGESYLVTANGTVDGVEFTDGDRIIAIADNASTTVYAGNWYKADYTDRVNNVVGLTGSISQGALLTALGVEANADVTDATNVAAAGAVMDGDFTDPEGFMRKTGAGAYQAIKSNLSASTAPTVNDDSSAGYAKGSVWIDGTGLKIYMCFDASVGAAVWIEAAGGGETADKFGINTTADATNRLAVKSDGVLFSHDDVTPGNDDCVVKVNKKAVGDTGSVQYQTNGSGRAELGLTGDDDFHIKVSPDNFTSVFEALLIDKDNGKIALGGGAPDAQATLSIKGTATGANPDLVLYGEAKGRFQNFDVYSGDQTFHAPYFQMRRARGSLATPANVADGDTVAGIPIQVYANGAFTTRARIQAEVNGTVSGSTAPVDLYFATGTTGETERMRIHSDGSVVVGAPTGGAKGAGTVNAQAVYDDNTLLTCYVFDQALDGTVDPAKWDARVPDRHVVERDPATNEIRRDEIIVRDHEPLRKFAARIGTQYDPLTLDGYAKHWKDKRHLTAMPNEAAFDPVNGQLTAGEWIQRLVETVEIQAVLIEQLNARVKALEGGR